MDDYNNLKKLVSTSVDKKSISKALLNGTKLQEQWFPVNADWATFDIFISHSHKDLNTYILPLASWFWENFGLTCFIDSLFWQYADGLLGLMDEIYSKKDDGYFDYKIRNYTTSHIHAMLSMALMQMMAKTECVLFVDSDNSLKYTVGATQTPSPWLYEEINFASNLQIIIPDRYKKLTQLFESGGRIHDRCFSQREMNVMYDVDLSRFYELKANFLMRGIEYKENKALDYMHRAALSQYKRM